MAALDRRIIYHFDWTLFSLALALCGVGILSVVSATWGGNHHGIDPLVMRQLIWVGAGTALMTTAALVDYRALGTYAYAFYVLAVAMLLAVAVVGHSTGGSRRWINIGILNLEPSEVAKIAVVLVMVRYLCDEP